VVGSSVSVGNPAVNFSSANSITGNGTGAAIAATNKGGINVFLNSNLDLRDADISNNTGAGLQIVMRSAVRSFATTINNNTGDGIHLIQGSALRLDDPRVRVVGNGRFGIDCADRSSSVGGDIAGVSGNGRANIGPECRGF